MSDYIPKQGSTPARLIAHLQAHGGRMRNIEVAAFLGVADKSVQALMQTAVKHGLLSRTAQGYALAGTPEHAGEDATTSTWGGASKPAFPSAPPRGDDPPPRKMRTLKEVAADFHAGRAVATAPRHTALSVVATTTEPASLRQIGGTHYKQMAVQPWDVVDGWPLDQRIGYYRGNALKYLMRMGSKDQDAQEVAKGRHYIEKLLEVLQEQDVQVAAT